MLTGSTFVIAFIAIVVLMITAISAFRIHPFLAIMAAAFVLGALFLDCTETLDVMLQGFSGTFVSIGIIVIMGTLIGMILEQTGAALKMSDIVVKCFGSKRPSVSMAVMGWIASISVFCDSGFVILNPVRKAIVKQLKTSSVAATVALSLGLFLSHCLIPPTPGPIAAAGALHAEQNILLVIAFGTLVSIPSLIAVCLFANFIGKRVKDKNEQETNEDALVKSYDELVASYGRLPNAFLSFTPILLPIVLMACASFCSMSGKHIPIVDFLGKPTAALPIGFLASLILLFNSGKMKDLYDLTNDSLKIAGPILFITAAGSALGKIVGASPLIPFLSEHSNVLGTMGIFFPFLFAAILKTAQGSSTVALTTTAGIVAPMLAQLGLDSPALTALTVAAIGAGAMTVSHVNDSYFWVVLNFGELKKASDGYKTQALGSMLVGLTTMAGVFVLSLFIH